MLCEGDNYIVQHLSSFERVKLQLAQLLLSLNLGGGLRCLIERRDVDVGACSLSGAGCIG